MSAAHANASRPLGILHSPVIHTGVFAGVLLVGVMVASLYIANHVPRFDEVASLRNLAFYGTFGVAMAIPIARYLGSPWKVFVSGMTAWSLLSGAYACATMFFENLINRLHITPFHLLMLGAMIYGLIAAMTWVAATVVFLLRRGAHPHRSSAVEVARQKQ
jgi:hypothetical protein